MNVYRGSNYGQIMRNYQCLFGLKLLVIIHEPYENILQNILDENKKPIVLCDKLNLILLNVILYQTQPHLWSQVFL